MLPFISVVMPLYNEEKYIDGCIKSLLKQDYPKQNMEWIFVDGCSRDNTKATLIKYKNKYPQLIYIYDNPNKTVPYAMNLGIKNARGEYIVRLDAHADYSNDYISKCIHYLMTIDADNVGGIAETKSEGFVGNAIAKMLSSKFGVGNSQFRTGGCCGYVDTVPFGAFKRSVFEKWGLYDVRLTRNQDNEMNYRIRKNGGKIYLSDDIHFSYYCRNTIKGIVDMAVKNGMWNIITMKLCPGSMGIRHFIPLIFLLSLVFMPMISLKFNLILYIFICELILYFCLAAGSAIKSSKCIKEQVLICLLFPIFHISYGYGSLKGIIKLFSGEYKK